MSPVVLKGVQDVNALFTKVRLLADETSKHVREELPVLMEGIVTAGEEDMKQIITEAVTSTGEARAAGTPSSKRDAGLGIAGRVETDDMRQSVVSNVETNGNTVTGTWGWAENYQDYFAIQENGFGNLQGMHALLGSFVNGREQLRLGITKVIEESTK